jgi:hypothetical protein
MYESHTMLKKCKTCEKEFEGNAREFCSWQCEENYKTVLRKKLDKTMKKDKSHTDKLRSDS